MADDGVDVALALGGGAARGLAHIGVIRVLEERGGVRVRAVAGTSIGAIIGGLYCGGALDRYEEYICAMDARGILRLLDPIMPRSGLLGGERIVEKLHEFLGQRDVAELVPPFCAVATDLRSGDEVRLRRGDLVESMRASWAIPGIFTPRRVAGRWLVDGGVSTPLPIGAARELNSGLPVIAVNLNNSNLAFEGEIVDLIESSPAEQAEQEAGRLEKVWTRVRSRRSLRPGIISSVSDSVTHLEYRVSQYQIEAEKPELVLEPAVYGLGLFDFHHAEEIIAAGERCADAAIEDGSIAALTGGGDGRHRASGT